MSWLDKYYTPYWKNRLHPTAVYDGKYHAVVRVVDEGRVGFILVRKSGQHGVTPHEVLLEGMPNASDYQKMRETLAERDSRAL